MSHGPFEQQQKPVLLPPSPRGELGGGTRGGPVVHCCLLLANIISY
jgi:hypothetical protein